MKLKDLFVPALFVVAFAVLLDKIHEERSIAVAKRDAVLARHQKAGMMLQERCKKAGVFIRRTAENVEGIFLLKLRSGDRNFRHQYRMDDPYGKDFGGDAYIMSFLWDRDEKGLLDHRKAGGYRYVDAIDPKDGKRYRYTGGTKVVGKADINAKGVQMALKRNPKHDLNIYRFVLDRVPAPDPAPRYGVTYDDISTREERDYWIAGSSLRVIDLATNEVMAERIGYMMDSGQGNDSGGRAPWLFAADNACPRFGPKNSGVPASFDQTRQTRNFVEKVLHTIQEK
jgi:hypothetical protein